MTFARRPQGVLSRIVPDRRRHKRLSVTLLGRFMLQSKEEHPCKLIDISASGAAIMSPAAVRVGERVVAYFDHIGGIEGLVVREFEGGFAFQFNSTKHKREKLAAQLTWLANRSELVADGRRHERVTPKNGNSTLHLSEGITLTCRVLDVSISGASIATPARPEIGTEVVLGKLRARVVRHHPQGFGVQFIDIQNPTALRRHFGRETAADAPRDVTEI
jgi:PilZ domain